MDCYPQEYCFDQQGAVANTKHMAKLSPFDNWVNMNSTVFVHYAIRELGLKEQILKRICYFDDKSWNYFSEMCKGNPNIIEEFKKDVSIYPSIIVNNALELNTYYACLLLNTFSIGIGTVASHIKMPSKPFAFHKDSYFEFLRNLYRIANYTPKQILSSLIRDDERFPDPVSYTHLKLPTKRIV